MIIYGSYSLTVREYTYAELGPEITPFFQAGDRLRKRVLVFHLFGIPVFPLRRLWECCRDGEKYEVEGRAWALLDRKFGRIKAPITAYLGPLVLGVLVLVFGLTWLNTAGKEMATEALESRSTKKTWRSILDDPTENDYLVLKNPYTPERFYFKVHSVGDDAITFSYPTNPSQPIGSMMDQGKFVAQEFLFPSVPMAKIKIKKEQLQKMVDSFDDDERAGIKVKQLNRGNTLVIDDVQRYDDSPFLSEEGVAITAVIKAFMSSKKNEERIPLIDRASRDYFRWVWEKAQLSIEAIKDTAAASTMPMVNFKVIAHTKYRFQVQQPAATYDAATETAFLHYVSLLDQGWWTQDNERLRRCCDYLDIAFKDDQRAELAVDYVDRAVTLLGKSLLLQKEGGKWRIDIPSSLIIQEAVWQQELETEEKTREKAQQEILNFVRG